MLQKEQIISEAKEIHSLARTLQKENLYGIGAEISYEEALKLIELAILLRK